MQAGDERIYKPDSRKSPKNVESTTETQRHRENVTAQVDYVKIIQQWRDGGLAVRNMTRSLCHVDREAAVPPMPPHG
jgi:hypothetical protein